MDPSLVRTLPVADRVHLWVALEKASALTASDWAERFEVYYDEVLGRMGGYAAQLGGGEITPAQFRTRMLATMRRAFADAYRYGVGASGGRVVLSDQDLGVIRMLLNENAEYLSTFVAQFRDGYVPVNPQDRGPGTGRFTLSDRTELYGHAIRNAYFAGYTARGDALDTYDWLLGVAEHCEPCLDMAERSPWTKVELAGRRPGPTVCDGLNRCQCSLVKVNDTSGYLRHLLAGAARVEL